MYAVKEIFHTLQGEGFHTGRAAVFLRFSGCNLWSGRAADRSSGTGDCARWCDTDFVGTDGVGGGRFADADALADQVRRCWGKEDRGFVVCTGGEPLLQLDAALIHALHRRDFAIAIETNGTRPVPPGVDWVCVSPKAGAPLVVTAGDELKLVYPQRDCPPEAVASLDFRHRFIQPRFDPDPAVWARHREQAVAYCQAHPSWRLSVQVHKILGIP